MRRFLTVLAFALAIVLPLHASGFRIWKGTQLKNAAATLTPYLPAPEKALGVAVIVCPGGSYYWLDRTGEEKMAARWLADNGIAAFVLHYRTAGWFSFAFRAQSHNRYPDPMQDIQRSIQLVRERSAEYGIDPGKVGIMGFSAGGHLAMSAAEFAGTDFLAPLGIATAVSLAPSFVAPVYPVVTLADERFVHSKSRRALMGEKRVSDMALRDSLSLERHVKAGLPPVFLLCCEDDGTVDYHNSVMLDSALRAEGVPHLYTQYRSGGHGFGANPRKQNDETSGWQDLFMKWIEKIYEKD